MPRAFGAALWLALLPLAAACGVDDGPRPDAGACARCVPDGGADGGVDAGVDASVDGGTDAGCLEAQAPGAPDPARAERVLTPLSWTTTSLYDDPAERLELAKPAGDTDTVELLIEQGSTHTGARFVELSAEAVASSDRLVRFAWRYEGRRDLNEAPTTLRVYAEGPEGRTALTVFEDETAQQLALEGEVSVALHEGYAFGLHVFEPAVNELATSFRLTTLDSRPLDAPPPAAPPSAAEACAGTPEGPNQAPLLGLGAELVFDTDPPPYVGLRWASLAPGPAAEAGQRLEATIAVLETSGTLAFDAPPRLDVATGDLHLALREGSYGAATLELTLEDDGGTAGGGVDTARGVFTVRVNAPPVSRDTVVVHAWKTECVPLTFYADESDPRDHLWLEITAPPAAGFLSSYTTDTSGRIEVMGSGGPTASHVVSLCYTAASSTFTGLDAVAFRFLDKHGGASAEHAVSIEIFER